MKNGLKSLKLCRNNFLMLYSIFIVGLKERNLFKLSQRNVNFYLDPKKSEKSYYRNSKTFEYI